VLLLRRAFLKCEGTTHPGGADGDEAVAYLGAAAPFSDRERYPLPLFVCSTSSFPVVRGSKCWPGSGRSRPSLPLARADDVVFVARSGGGRAYRLGANSFSHQALELPGLVTLVGVLWRLLLRFASLPPLAAGVAGPGDSQA